MCICIYFCGLLPCFRTSSELNQKFILGPELGRGSSGITRLCTERSTGEQFACKTVKTQRDSKEAIILKRLKCHPHIVNLIAIYKDVLETHMVMELCSGGSLFSKRKVYSEAEGADLCKSLMEAVQFCHARGIVHRDITLKNILLGDDNPSSVKLADFGLAEFVGANEYLQEMVGTLPYLAPEMLRRKYGKEVDVWSAGVVLYCILSGYFPFYGNTVRSILYSIESSKCVRFHPDGWKNGSEEVKNLIRGMLDKDPKTRLTPEQVLNHEWVVRNTTGVKRDTRFVSAV